MDETTTVVTGASRGIGEAVAHEFADAGSAVVLAARSGDEVESVASSIREDGGDATAMRADVRDEFDLERLMETASREGGGIDHLVASAGVYHGDPGETPLADDSYTAFDDTIGTNARGVFGAIRESVPHLTDDARILVPTGPVASEAQAGYGAYAVSKAAAEAIVRQYAGELDPVVGCVDPGAVATELTGGHGRDPAEVAGLFRWAATAVDPDELDGEVVGLREWKAATR